MKAISTQTISRKYQDISRRGFVVLVSRSISALGLAELLAFCGDAPGHSAQRPARTPPTGGPTKGSTTPFITSNNDFYSVSIAPAFAPPVTPQTVEQQWKLELLSQGAAAGNFSYADIRNMTAVARTYTYECIGNQVGGPLIGNAKWKAAPLSQVLAPVLPSGSPTSGFTVMFRAMDGFFSSVSLQRCLDPESFLAYEMNGEPLPAAHGFPVRVMLPDLYGMKQPRWITSIEVLATPVTTGYWDQRSWASEVPIKTTARFDPPDPSVLVAGTGYTLSGISFGGARGVGAVEVSLDEGQTWQPARLIQGGSSGVWAVWQYDWSAPSAGKHTLLCRATDALGATQVATAQGPFPDGASGYHQVLVDV